MSKLLKSLKILGIIILCIILLLSLFGCDCNAGSDDSQSQKAIVITATDFLTEFYNNSFDFEIKYKDKVVQLSGKIAIIGEVDGVPIIDIFSDSYELYSVYAYFESSSSQLLNLAKGYYVTVQGVYTGEGIFALELHNCTLIN